METLSHGVSSAEAEAHLSQLFEYIKCFLCDHDFDEDEERWLIFEKIPKERVQVHDTLSGILTSSLGIEVSEETAHSTFLCNECNYKLQEYGNIEQRYYEMRFQLLTEYNTTAEVNGLPTIPIENNGMFQKYLTVGLDIKSQETDGSQQEYILKQFPIGNELTADVDDAHDETGISEELNCGFEQFPSSKYIVDDFELVYDVEDIEIENMANTKIDPDIIYYDSEQSSEVSNEHDASVDSQNIESLSNSSWNNKDSSADMVFNIDGYDSNFDKVIGQTAETKNQSTKSPTPQCEDTKPPIYKDQGKIYTCSLCSTKQEYSRESLDEHMREQHNCQLYTCDVCGSGFLRRQSLIDHMEQLQHGKFTCETCQCVFENYSLFHIHKSMHCTNAKQFECTQCHKKYTSKMLFERHMNMHTGHRPYKCPQCSKGFTSKYTLQVHLKIHSDRQRPYRCDKCDKAFLNQQNLTQHLKLHSGIKSFMCEICSKAFVTKQNLFRHQILHSGHKSFVCLTCGKAFFRRAEMKNHERIHTGERPFKCDICEMAFAQSSNLTSHKKAIHFNERLHKCEQCGRSFKRRRLLDYHINSSHTGDRPFKCEVCGASFVYPEHRKKHMLVHDGVKPFSCEICGKRFTNRVNRNAHRFSHTNKKPYECLECGAGFIRKPLLFSHMKRMNHSSDTIIVNKAQIGECDIVNGEDLAVDGRMEGEAQSLSQSEIETRLAVDMLNLYTSHNDSDGRISNDIKSFDELEMW